MQRAAASTLGVRLQDCASHCVTALRGSRLSHDGGRSCEANAHGRAPRDQPASASPLLSKAAWGPAGTAVPPKVPWKRHARPCPTTALIVIRTGDRAGAQPAAERLAAAARPACLGRDGVPPAGSSCWHFSPFCPGPSCPALCLSPLCHSTGDQTLCSHSHRTGLAPRGSCQPTSTTRSLRSPAGGQLGIPDAATG